MYQNTQPSKKPVLVGAAAVALLVGAATYSMQSTEAPAAIELFEGYNDYDLTEADTFNPFDDTQMGATASANFSLDLSGKGAGIKMSASATVTVKQKAAAKQACANCIEGGYSPCGMNKDQFQEAHGLMLSQVSAGVEQIYSQNTNTLNPQRSSEAIQWLRQYNQFYNNLDSSLDFSAMIRSMKTNSYTLMESQQTIRAVGVDFTETSNYAFMNFEEFCTVTHQAANMKPSLAEKVKYVKKAQRSFSKHVRNLKKVTQRSIDVLSALEANYTKVKKVMFEDMIKFNEMVGKAKSLVGAGNINFEAIQKEITDKIAVYKKAMKDLNGLNYGLNMQERKTIDEAVKCEGKNQKCHKLTAAIANSYTSDLEFQMDSCAGAAGQTNSATASAGMDGTAVSAAAQTSMFYGYCAQANAKGRGKYEEYQQQEKLECVDVDICSVTLAKAQELRRTQNAEIDKWNAEMALQVKDKDFAEQKDKIQKLLDMGLEIAALKAKLMKAKAQKYQLATVMAQQDEIFKDMQEMYSMASEQSANDGGNLRSVAKAFQVTDENMKMTDYDAIEDEQSKEEALDNILLLGNNADMQQMTLKRLMKINKRGQATTKYAKMAENAYKRIIYQKYVFADVKKGGEEEEEFELF